MLGLRRSRALDSPLPSLKDRFGIRSLSQISRDLQEVIQGSLGGQRFQFGLSSAGLLRPDLSLPAYAGLIPEDGLAPIFNLFDRTGGGLHYSQRVTRKTVRDFRGGRLSYDEHDGVDLVCPIGTPLVAAAPGTVVMIRDRWLRGGLTIALDHGHGVLTQYTHCAEALLPLGAQVERGEPVARSGAAGFDMVQFFPWVPPHIHFMVWIQGRPVDPYLAKDEPSRPGAWLPRPSTRRSEDPWPPPLSQVNEQALQAAADACLDPRINTELHAVRDRPPMLAALLEDALHHDEWAFSSPKPSAQALRPPEDAAQVTITLPLPKGPYAGAIFADSPLTRP